MYPNRLYKHKNNTDVAFVPVNVLQGQSDLLVFGKWFNIVNPNNVYLIDSDQITINLSDLEKWEQIDVLSGRIL